MTTGATFMFAFGIVWLLLGLFRGRSSPVWVRIALLLLGIGLGAPIFTLGSRASRLPHDVSQPMAEQRAANREIGRHFYMIFGAELAAIFVAVVVLRLIHYPDYILPGIAVIVGVHFVPLAALFKSPVFYGTGVLGCIIGVAGFLVADAGLRQKVVGLSFGLMLWATAAWILCQGFYAMQPVVSRSI
jgi:hypothetical protein